MERRQASSSRSGAAVAASRNSDDELSRLEGAGPTAQYAPEVPMQGSPGEADMPFGLLDANEMNDDSLLPAGFRPSPKGSFSMGLVDTPQWDHEPASLPLHTVAGGVGPDGPGDALICSSPPSTPPTRTTAAGAGEDGAETSVVCRTPSEPLLQNFLDNVAQAERRGEEDDQFLLSTGPADPEAEVAAAHKAAAQRRLHLGGPAAAAKGPGFASWAALEDSSKGVMQLGAADGAMGGSQQQYQDQQHHHHHHHQEQDQDQADGGYGGDMMVDAFMQHAVLEAAGLHEDEDLLGPPPTLPELEGQGQDNSTTSAAAAAGHARAGYTAAVATSTQAADVASGGMDSFYLHDSGSGLAGFGGLAPDDAEEGATSGSAQAPVAAEPLVKAGAETSPEAVAPEGEVEGQAEGRAGQHAPEHLPEAATSPPPSSHIPAAATPPSAGATSTPASPEAQGSGSGQAPAQAAGPRTSDAETHVSPTKQVRSPSKIPMGPGSSPARNPPAVAVAVATAGTPAAADAPATAPQHAHHAHQADVLHSAAHTRLPAFSGAGAPHPTKGKQTELQPVHGQPEPEAAHGQLEAKAMHGQPEPEAVHELSEPETVHEQSALGAAPEQVAPEAVPGNAAFKLVHARAEPDEAVHEQAEAGAEHAEPEPNEAAQGLTEPKEEHGQSEAEAMPGQSEAEHGEPGAAAKGEPHAEPDGAAQGEPHAPPDAAAQGEPHTEPAQQEQQVAHAGPASSHVDAEEQAGETAQEQPQGQQQAAGVATERQRRHERSQLPLGALGSWGAHVPAAMPAIGQHAGSILGVQATGMEVAGQAGQAPVESGSTRSRQMLQQQLLQQPAAVATSAAPAATTAAAFTAAPTGVTAGAPASAAAGAIPAPGKLQRAMWGSEEVAGGPLDAAAGALFGSALKGPNSGSSTRTTKPGASSQDSVACVTSPGLSSGAGGGEAGGPGGPHRSPSRTTSGASGMGSLLKGPWSATSMPGLGGGGGGAGGGLSSSSGPLADLSCRAQAAAAIAKLVTGAPASSSASSSSAAAGGAGRYRRSFEQPRKMALASGLWSRHMLPAYGHGYGMAREAPGGGTGGSGPGPGLQGSAGVILPGMSRVSGNGPQLEAVSETQQLVRGGKEQQGRGGPRRSVTAGSSGTLGGGSGAGAGAGTGARQRAGREGSRGSLELQAASPLVRAATGSCADSLGPHGLGVGGLRAHSFTYRGEYEQVFGSETDVTSSRAATLGELQASERGDYTRANSAASSRWSPASSVSRQLLRNVGDENTGQLPWASVDGPASIPAPDHSSSSASAAQGGGGSGSQGSKRGSSVGSASSATAAATSQGLPGPRGSGPGMGALPTAPSAPAPAAAAGLGLGVIAAPGPGPVAGATAGAGLSTEVPALQGRPSAPAPAGLEGSEASPSATPAAGPAAASNQHTTGKVGTAMHSRLPHAPTGPGAGAGIGAGAAAVLGVGVQPATMGISTEAAVEAASAVVASADGRLGAAGDTGGALAPGPSAIASRKSQEMATLGIAPRSPSISSLALRHGPSRLAQMTKAEELQAKAVGGAGPSGGDSSHSGANPNTSGSGGEQQGPAAGGASGGTTDGGAGGSMGSKWALPFSSRKSSSEPGKSAIPGTDGLRGSGSPKHPPSPKGTAGDASQAGSGGLGQGMEEAPGLMDSGGSDGAGGKAGLGSKLAKVFGISRSSSRRSNGSTPSSSAAMAAEATSAPLVSAGSSTSQGQVSCDMSPRAGAGAAGGSGAGSPGTAGAAHNASQGNLQELDSPQPTSPALAVTAAAGPELGSGQAGSGPGAAAHDSASGQGMPSWGGEAGTDGAAVGSLVASVGPPVPVVVSGSMDSPAGKTRPPSAAGVSQPSAAQQVQGGQQSGAAGAGGGGLLACFGCFKPARPAGN